MASRNSHSDEERVQITAQKLRTTDVPWLLADQLANGYRHASAFAYSNVFYAGILVTGFLIFSGMMVLYRPLANCVEMSDIIGVALFAAGLSWLFFAAALAYMATHFLSEKNRSALFLSWVEMEGGSADFYWYYVGKAARDRDAFDSADAFIRAFMNLQFRLTLFVAVPLAFLAWWLLSSEPTACLPL